MTWWGIILIVLGTLIFFAFLHFIGKNKRPLKRALISMLLGLGALLGVNLTSVFTGVFLPVSILSLLVSLIGGIPGVSLMLGLNLYF